MSSLMIRKSRQNHPVSEPVAISQTKYTNRRTKCRENSQILPAAAERDARRMMGLEKLGRSRDEDPGHC